jgi:hypothetical protein
LPTLMFAGITRDYQVPISLSGSDFRRSCPYPQTLNKVYNGQTI